MTTPNEPTNINGRQLAMQPLVTPSPVPTVVGVAKVQNTPDGPMLGLQTWSLTGHHVVFLTLDVATQLRDMLTTNLSGLHLPPPPLNGLGG